MDGPRGAIFLVSEKAIEVAFGATVSGGMRQTSAVMLLPFLRADLMSCVVSSGVARLAVDLWAPTGRSKAVGRPFYVVGVSAARANTPVVRIPRMLVVVAARVPLPSLCAASGGLLGTPPPSYFVTPV